MSRRQPFVDFFFFATSRRSRSRRSTGASRRPRPLRRPHGPLPRRLRAEPARALDGRFTAGRDHVRILPRLPRRVPAASSTSRRPGARAVGEGDGQVRSSTSCSCSRPSRSSRDAARSTTGRRSALLRRSSPTRSTGCPARGRPARGNLTPPCSRRSPGARQINMYGAVEGASVYRVNALTGDPNHLAIELLVAALLLPTTSGSSAATRFWMPLVVRYDPGAIELATFSRSGCRALFGLLVLAVPSPATFSAARFLPLGASSCPARPRRAARQLLREVIKSRVDTSGKETHPFLGLRVHPTGALTASALGLGSTSRSTTSSSRVATTSGRTRSTSPCSSRAASSGRCSSPFLGYLFYRLSVGRSIGRGLQVAGDELAARVRPMEWG